MNGLNERLPPLKEFILPGGSEAAARSRGLIRLEGKEYVVRDGDIIHFKVAA